MDSENVDNVGIRLLSLHNTDSKQLACETDSQDSDLADSLLLGKTGAFNLNETNIKNYSQP